MISATINLRNDSLVYDQFTYPAGEHQIRFRGRYPADDVTVIARLSNGEDIVKLALLKSALGDTPSRLILPYLPYSRADRRFTDGDCFGLRAFGKIINSMEFGSVITMDAHNAKSAEAQINYLSDVSAGRLIEDAIVGFARYHRSKHITVLFPDQGARLRYSLPRGVETNTERVGITIEHCEKKRDPSTGKLEGFTVPSVPDRYPAIIIDDICDGGATFTGIAKQCSSVHLGLYVTHGIFSRGHAPLLEYFEHIYTTNTIEQKAESDRVTVLDALPFLLGR